MEIIIVLLATAILLYFVFRKKNKSSVFAPNLPSPEEARLILVEWVSFYTQLIPEEKQQFEARIFHFLKTTQITGIKTKLDNIDKILVASSAIIPVFSFPEWEYLNLEEVLIYPSAFDEDFEMGGSDGMIQGMVGTGYMEGKMILSKPALRQGFKNERDKKNVGIHEFVHLIDKADGSIDGIPEKLLQKQYTTPWLDLIQNKMDEIHALKSDINAYGGVDKAEFFPVISEYFFERPKLLEQKHPKLYAILQDIFTIDLAEKYKIKKPQAKTQRNDPCPCGSSKKYKVCCGKYEKR